MHKQSSCVFGIVLSLDQAPLHAAQIRNFIEERFTGSLEKLRVNLPQSQQHTLQAATLPFSASDAVAFACLLLASSSDPGVHLFCMVELWWVHKGHTP